MGMNATRRFSHEGWEVKPPVNGRLILDFIKLIALVAEDVEDIPAFSSVNMSKAVGSLTYACRVTGRLRREASRSRFV